jgi:PAS domain S-box-containing protein
MRRVMGRASASITVLIFITVLPIAVVSGFAATILADRYRHNREETLAAAAETAMISLKAAFSSVRSTGLMLANLGDLERDDIPRFHDIVRTTIRTQPLIEAAALTDPHSGKILFDTRLASPPDVPDPATGDCAGTPPPRALIISGAFVSSVSKRLTIPVCVPILRDNSPYRLLILLIDVRHLREVLSEDRLGDQIRLGIIGPNGLLAAAVNRPDLEGRMIRPEWRQAVADRSHLVRQLPSIDQRPVYAAFATMAGGWTAAVAQPVELIDEPVREIMLVLGSGGLIMVLIAGGLAAAFGLGMRALHLAEQRMRQELDIELAERTAALHLREAELTGILDGVGDAIITADRRGMITSANRAASTIFGWTHGEMEGRNLSMLMEEPYRSAHDGYIQRYLDTREPHILGVRSREVVGCHRDGTPIDLELVVCKAESQGGELRFVGVLRDIRDRKKRDAELRNWFETFNRCDVAIAVADPRTNRLLMANPAYCRMHRATAQQLMDGRWEELYAPGEFTRVQQQMTRADQVGKVEFECVRMRFDRSAFPALVLVTSIPGSGSEAPRRVIAVLDITQHRAVESQLSQMQKMQAIGTLTGGMAHDFNNILSVIIGNLDLLDHLQGRDGEHTDLIDGARNAAQHGADLVRRMLAFARKQPLVPRVIDVNDLIVDLHRMLIRTLGDRIEVRLDLDPAVRRLRIDAVQLESALTNLAINARDAMPRGGQLVISTANEHLEEERIAYDETIPPGDYVLISVRDTGVGMPREVRQHIFEPFFTTKPAGSNSGLGLSMVFGFVRQSQGYIDVESEPGAGTTFLIRLPATDASLTTVTVAEAVPPGGGSATILLVEDNAALRRVTARILRDLGYRVLEAANAGEATVQLERSGPVDVLFTDIEMPGAVSGLELAQATVARYPGLRVLITTGNSITASLPNNTESSPFTALAKPYQRLELARTLRMLLDSPAR